MNGDSLLSPHATSVLAAALASLGALAVAMLAFTPRAVAVVRRDLTAFFVTPVAYVTLLFYAYLGGSSFIGSLRDLQLQDEPSLAGAFLGSLSSTLLVAPVLTMRLLAEERERGTLELLLTTVTRPWEVVLGKYVAAMLLYALLIGLTGIYYLAVVRCLRADIDHGQVLAGYVGMLCFGSALVSIGLMVSAFCKSAMSAVVVTLGVFFALLLLDTAANHIRQLVAGITTLLVADAEGRGVLARVDTATRETLTFLSMNSHIAGFFEGRIDMRDIAYLSSVTAFCLTMVLIALHQKRN